MKYTPKTRDQLEKESLLPEGIYDFEIIETSDRPSKAGNEMIMLKFCVFDETGRQHYIFDYMVFGNNFGERKLFHAADACGIMDIYDSGALKDSDFMGCTGKMLVKQQDGTGEFPAKNIVGDYVPQSATDKPTTPRKTKDMINDDIPF